MIDASRVNKGGVKEKQKDEDDRDEETRDDEEVKQEK